MYLAACHCRMELMVPSTVYAAFQKASHYFGVKVVVEPVDANYTVSTGEVEKLINENTKFLDWD